MKKHKSFFSPQRAYTELLYFVKVAEANLGYFFDDEDHVIKVYVDRTVDPINVTLTGVGGISHTYCFDGSDCTIEAIASDGFFGEEGICWHERQLQLRDAAVIAERKRQRQTAILKPLWEEYTQAVLNARGLGTQVFENQTSQWGLSLLRWCAFEGTSPLNYGTKEGFSRFMTDPLLAPDNWDGNIPKNWERICVMAEAIAAEYAGLQPLVP